jgi:phi LC3 family holin
VLALLDVAPAITQDSVMQLIAVVLSILSGIGVVVDPTTPGFQDSERAMLYSKPGQFDLEYTDEQ